MTCLFLYAMLEMLVSEIRLMQILFIGDIFGNPGRKIVRDHLPHLMETNKVDLVVANAENAAGGFGVTPSIAEDLFDLGCDVLTTGNHVWDKREIMEYFNSANGDPKSRARRVLRPANFYEGVPGVGVFEGVTRTGHKYAVINLMGRVFMHNTDDPFRKVDELLKQITSKVILIDLHAEATSEKIAMGWYLDGRVTAVLGTHTHVPTADTCILPKGTAYQTDVGMSGPFDGVIGVQKEQVLQRFLTGLPGRFEPAKGDPRLCGVLIECDPENGRATSIKRLMLGE
jgi:2',3'-cyclic-nucleotide 2'-phosphodiesterase